MRDDAPLRKSPEWWQQHFQRRRRPLLCNLRNHSIPPRWQFLCSSNFVRFLFLTCLIHLTRTSIKHDNDKNHKSSLSIGVGVGVSGKEIVAQRDTWTLIGENDTVDAGMHIRIDMTTGEKWVKQIVEDEHKENRADVEKENTDPDRNRHPRESTRSSSSSSSSSSSAAVIVSTIESDEGQKYEAAASSSNEQQRQTELNLNGEVQATMELPKQIIHNDNASESKSSSDPKYDYDMMYRTLRKLPIEEQIRIQLPTEYVADDEGEFTTTSPSSSLSFNDTTTKQQRRQFETKLRYIWEQRQKELLELEIADLPQVLKEYIMDLQTFISQQQQQQQIHDIVDESTNNQTIHTSVNSTKIDTNEKNVFISHDHILSVLQELEYQLQDIDLTRDFHTLHGWHRLVSLLGSSNISWSNDAATSVYQQHEVQMHTAWVIGTALKHIPEFHTYAIEPIQLFVPSSNRSTTSTTTTLDLVLQQIQSSYEEYVTATTAERRILRQEKITNEISTEKDKIDLISKLLQTKLLRFIYCLGSLLRGNYYSQQHLLLSPQQSEINHNKTINLLEEFMNRVLLPSLQQIHHHELVRSIATNNNNSGSIDSNSETKQQIDFLYKFVKRSLNVLSDCLNEIQSNINDNDDNPKWNLQHTNPTQYQQLQTIYRLWHHTICNTTTSIPDSTIATAEERILRHHQSNNGSIMDLNSFLSSPTSSTDHWEEMEELRSTISSILSHCP